MMLVATSCRDQLSVIRAFGAEERFKLENQRVLHENQKVSFTSLECGQWLSKCAMHVLSRIRTHGISPSYGVMQMCGYSSSA